VAVLEWVGPADRGESAAVLAGLGSGQDGDRYRLGRRAVDVVTYLDTADRRLRREGLVLRHEGRPGSGRLVLVGPDGDGRDAVVQLLVESPVWPALVNQLPPGPVRDRIAGAAWVRALLPVAMARIATRDVGVINADGKVVVRLGWVEARGVDPVATPPLVRMIVRPVLGYRREAASVRTALLEGEGFRPAEVGVDEALLATLDAGPDTGSDAADRVAMTGDLPAGAAVAMALRGFADAIEANVPGVVADIDTEFLHDLRVAVRRTRSLLKLTADAVPARLTARYGPGFRWFGDLTTPTRDLDVFLLEVDDLAGTLVAGQPGDLVPFAEHLRRQRDAQWRAMVRGLRSARFARLMSGWRSALDELVADDHQPSDGVSARQLAQVKTRRALRRVTRTAQVITADSPAEQVHALRKRGKELRYALETFQPLCEPTAYRATVKALRRLQDVLGAFQDGEVQSAALREFAEQMLREAHAPASTLLAMGELAGHFAGQQRRARVELNDQLERYLRGGSGIGVKELFT
jgi:CHAD domain-containing protein